MKSIVATDASTLIVGVFASENDRRNRYCRTKQRFWRGMAPVRARIASRRVVFPLAKGPTMAMHFGPVRLPQARLPMGWPSTQVFPLERRPAGLRPSAGVSSQATRPAFGPSVAGAFPVKAAAGLRPSRGRVFATYPQNIVHTGWPPEKRGEKFPGDGPSRNQNALPPQQTPPPPKMIPAKVPDGSSPRGASP